MSVLTKIDALIDFVDEAEREQKSDGDGAGDGERITLGYWKIHGLAAPARMMLEFAEVRFKEVMYEQKGKEEGYSKDEWFSVKHELGFEFPNLPYLIDSKTGAKFTESRAIYRYIARQFGVGVQRDPELSTADMMNDLICGAMQPFTNLCYGHYDQQSKAEYMEQFAKKMKPFDEFMDGKRFIVGDTISFADFSLYYLMMAHLKMDELCFADFKNLQKFHERFQKMEFMTRWNRKYSKLALNNKHAKFR